jgi:phosphoglycolate phosphatase-like HAD superfamily hydrolase
MPPASGLPVSEARGHAATRPAGLLLDIGGVVHNTGVRLVGRLAEREPAMQHLKLFDVIVDASLTGVMKPDPRAFRGGAEALGLPPEQIVFLDDMPWNVEGARQAGMTAVRVPWDDPGPAIDTARKLLGLSPG